MYSVVLGDDEASGNRFIGECVLEGRGLTYLPTVIGTLDGPEIQSRLCNVILMSFWSGLLCW